MGMPGLGESRESPEFHESHELRGRRVTCGCDESSTPTKATTPADTKTGLAGSEGLDGLGGFAGFGLRGVVSVTLVVVMIVSYIKHATPINSWAWRGWAKPANPGSSSDPMNPVNAAKPAGVANRVAGTSNGELLNPVYRGM